MRRCSTFLRKGLMLLAGGLCFTACHTQQAVVAHVVETKAPAQAVGDTTTVPAFSGEVLYVLAQEYEAIQDSLSPKFNTPQAQQVRERHMDMGEYVEQRLENLFEKEAYKGMVQKWRLIASALLPKDEPTSILYLHPEKRQAAVSNTQFPMSQNDTQEVVLLQMDKEEQAVFEHWNELARGERFASRHDFKHATCETHPATDHDFAPPVHDSFEPENILFVLLEAGGPYAFYRVLLSKQRAQKMATQHFGTETSGGKMGDAYKHLLVNVLLTSYLNEKVAEFVMNEVWEQWHINANCDRYMDLHNNLVGRQTRYWDLRGNTQDWHQWAEHVYEFVQDTARNAVYEPWNRETPLFQIQYDLRNAPEDQFIFWARPDSTLVQ